MGKEDGMKEWRDSLKSVLKKTSQTTSHNVLFLYDSQMNDEKFVEDINCILYCGEVIKISLCHHSSISFSLFFIFLCSCFSGPKLDYCLGQHSLILM